MLTIIKAMQQVIGSEIILFGTILCVIFFSLVFIAFKSNRSKKAVTIYFAALFFIFEFCDIIWLKYFFPEGKYIDRGLAPVGIFLIFPLLCMLLNVFCTIINYNNKNMTL